MMKLADYESWYRVGGGGKPVHLARASTPYTLCDYGARHLAEEVAHLALPGHGWPYPDDALCEDCARIAKPPEGVL
jgi:hypothetical protein